MTLAEIKANLERTRGRRAAPAIPRDRCRNPIPHRTEQTRRPARPVRPPGQTSRQSHKETTMMRTLFFLLCAPLLFAQGDEIRAMLKNSEAAWNRGDLAAFATDYEDSPDTTFIGRDITHGGVQAILDRYRRGYPTPEAMGTLDLFRNRRTPPWQRIRAGQRQVCAQTNPGGRRRCRGPFHPGAAQDQGRLEDHSRSFELVHTVTQHKINLYSD